jgi:hypothetical protein
MSTITIADLANAKTDVDHIATLATSSAMTATDRLGNTKSTMYGAVETLKSFTSRDAWATATAYAVKDLVSESGTWYVCVVAHTSSAAFATDTASKWRVYQGLIAADLASGATLTKVKSPRFEGTATDDAGTPDAIFKTVRTHVANTSPHAFRDETTFSPAGAGYSAASFDAALVSGGSAAIDHTIGFQARNTAASTGTQTNMYGFGSYPIVNAGATVTNVIGLDVAPHSGAGTVTNEYGVYIRNQNTTAANKYPLFIANNLGKNSIGAETNFKDSGILSVGTAVKMFIGDSANGYKSIAYNHNMNTNTYDYGDDIKSMYFDALDFIWRHAPAGVAGATPTFTSLLKIRTLAGGLYGSVYPGADGTQNLGIAGQGWKEVFATAGTINTSDARVKTSVRSFEDAELAASKQLGKEIGIFKFLAAIESKGDAARNHTGMTVQRAIEIMQMHGLDAMAYGFICYDEWDTETKDHPAIYSKVEDAEGNVVDGPITQEAWTETVRTAGNTYGFRTDQLLMFIARGFEARLAALEAA